jgi:hypothetical protein
MAAAVEKLDWDQINTVLLDLDGTLLDLSFDNDFGLDFIPAVYAASLALTVEQANACADGERAFLDRGAGGRAFRLAAQPVR